MKDPECPAVTEWEGPCDMKGVASRNEARNN